MSAITVTVAVLSTLPVSPLTAETVTLPTEPPLNVAEYDVLE